MAVKRRIVWFSDEDWADLQERARRSGYSVSEHLRRLTQPAVRPTMTATPPAPSLAIQQAERDRILKGVNRKS